MWPHVMTMWWETAFIGNHLVYMQGQYLVVDQSSNMFIVYAQLGHDGVI